MVAEEHKRSWPIRAYERIPPSVRVMWAAVCTVLTFLSLPSIREDVAGWAPWLSFIESAVGAYLVPALGLLGLALVVVLWRADQPAPIRVTNTTVASTAAQPAAEPGRQPARRVQIGSGRGALADWAPEVRDRNTLRRTLQALYEEGESLASRIPAPISSFVAAMHSSTREADVDEWELKVETALKRHPRLLSVFHREPRPYAFSNVGGFARTLVPPLKQRMQRRLWQLELIIRRL